MFPGGSAYTESRKIREVKGQVLKMSTQYLPEGCLLHTAHNQQAIRTSAGLLEAAEQQTILEARAVLCDAGHNLHVRLPSMDGIIPHDEGALGIKEGLTRDIALISRVSRPVCFVVERVETLPSGAKRAVLSRRKAQELCRDHYLSHLRSGDVIPARITRLESFGAFCDVGCGLPALLPIAGISVSRISHPSDRFKTGDDIYAVVTSSEEGRICLSCRELLGTWEENVALFSQGETVAGVVRSVEDYGIFVELTPNLAGLAELRDGVKVGQYAGVYIKSILPEKMKLKLILIDAQENPPPPQELTYFITGGHIDRWVYSPPESPRCIESVFR